MAKPDLSLDLLLPEADSEFLAEKYPTTSVYKVGDEVHALFPAFPFPDCYAPRTTDLLVRLPAGYADANPDMFWTRKDVKLVSGAWPQQCAHHEVPGAGKGVEVYAGVPWQRWSRHFDKAAWRPGVDGLRSYVRAIQRELERRV
jgi:hypothetical protein